MEASRQFGVTKLLYLGSSCIYPRHATQPITENELLTIPARTDQRACAIAKIFGIKLYDVPAPVRLRLHRPCRRTSTARTTTSISRAPRAPALIRKFPRRQARRKSRGRDLGDGFADASSSTSTTCGHACVFLMEHYCADEHINVGTGVDLSIADLARLVRSIVN
ncbi:MAG: NAD-dependent epimerase/dehydratase family protein [Ilumatobacteraceae bacterium]